MAQKRSLSVVVFSRREVAAATLPRRISTRGRRSQRQGRQARLAIAHSAVADVATAAGGVEFAQKQ